MLFNIWAWRDRRISRFWVGTCTIIHTSQMSSCWVLGRGAKRGTNKDCNQLANSDFMTRFILPLIPRIVPAEAYSIDGLENPIPTTLTELAWEAAGSTIGCQLE